MLTRRQLPGPRLLARSKRPRGQVPAHAGLPPPLPIHFFLPAKFSCVAAASCRVASTNCLFLAASSLLRGSCPGISCGQEERFAVLAPSPGLFACPSTPSRIPSCSHLQHRLNPLLSRGHEDKESGAHASPRAQHCAYDQRFAKGPHGPPRNRRGALCRPPQPPRLTASLHGPERPSEDTIEKGRAREGLISELFGI